MSSFSRREILKLSTLSIGALIAARCSPQEIPSIILVPTKTSLIDPDPSDRQSSSLSEALQIREADVIVVGAGIAGLAAARVLQEKALKIIVLEARNRIGGRIWTDRSTGTALDLGASWIHGIRNNPMTALADEIGARRIESDYENQVIYDVDGRKLSSSDIREGQRLFYHLADQLTEWQEEFDNDTSLEAAISQYINNRNYSIAQLQYLHFAINTTIEHEYAADVSKLSLWWFDDQAEYRGPDVIFPDGYGQIPTYLAVDLDIRLNHICTHVDYGTNGIHIQSNMGEFVARKSVISLPLGVLKAGKVSFSPELPSGKQRAIEALGFGVLNKVFLEFPNIFWEKEAHLLGYISKEKGRFSEWLNFVPLINEPILLAFNAGTFGLEIEDWSDAEIIELAMHTLKSIYGNGIPSPINQIITRWGKDPFSLGSYSSINKNASPAHYESLATSIDSQLYFAGEATHRNHPSTVHGAYLSGLRAAKEIINSWA